MIVDAVDAYRRAVMRTRAAAAAVTADGGYRTASSSATAYTPQPPLNLAYLPQTNTSEMYTTVMMNAQTRAIASNRLIRVFFREPAQYIDL